MISLIPELQDNATFATIREKLPKPEFQITLDDYCESQGIIKEDMNKTRVADWTGFLFKLNHGKKFVAQLAQRIQKTPSELRQEYPLKNSNLVKVNRVSPMKTKPSQVAYNVDEEDDLSMPAPPNMNTKKSPTPSSVKKPTAIDKKEEEEFEIVNKFSAMNVSTSSKKLPNKVDQDAVNQLRQENQELKAEIERLQATIKTQESTIGEYKILMTCIDSLVKKSSTL